jgi:putative SOS response-associated peptidase YedK
MCTNFSSTHQREWVEAKLNKKLPKDYPLDVYPGYEAPVLKARHGEIEDQMTLARFGLIPSWAKDAKIARHTYNARSESVEQKPSFKAAYRERRFSVVLIDDFFEPCYASGQAMRHRIHIESGAPFGVAGLWESWTPGPGHAVIHSFTMLTLNADAHPVMNKMHAPGDEKRTPLVLSVDQFEEWLVASHFEAQALLTGARMPTLISSPAPKIQTSKAVPSSRKSQHIRAQGSLFE